MEKVWKRLIAVSLSLMLMFTMGLNVFAAENVDGTPSDDPAVSLDESDAVVTDVESADEAVVQEEASDEVVAMSTSERGEVLVDNSTTLGDGEYVVNWTGGSSRVTLTCEKVFVADGKVTATFTTTSGTQTHVYTGAVEDPNNSYPELYDEETNTCADGVYPIVEKTFTIPVDLNEEMPLSIRTTSMGSVKWTHYSYKFELEEPEWKPTQNQDKFSGINYAKGMFSAAERGTTLTVNPDATISIHVTTKPMISNKYVKVAFSSDEINSENVEEIAATIPVETFTASDLYTNRQGEVVGQRSFYWSVFDYTVPLGMVDNKINVWAYNTLEQTDKENSIYEENLDSAAWTSWGTWTVIDTPELTRQIQEAYKNATSEEAKETFEKALKNSAYNIGGDSIAIAAIPAQTYKGKALTPEVTVMAGEKTLAKNTDYTIKYENNTNAGTAKVTLSGTGDYIGQKIATFTINPAAQKLNMSAAQKTVKFKKLKKKAQTTSKVAVTGAKTKVTYAKVGGSKKLSINKTTGKITVKKKTKKGTYKITVRATAAKTTNYKAATVTKTIKVKVKK